MAADISGSQLHPKCPISEDDKYSVDLRGDLSGAMVLVAPDYDIAHHLRQ